MLWHGAYSSLMRCVQYIVDRRAVKNGFPAGFSGSAKIAGKVYFIDRAAMPALC